MYLLPHSRRYGGRRDIGLNMAPLAKPTIPPYIALLALIQLETMTKIKTSLYVRKEKNFALISIKKY